MHVGDALRQRLRQVQRRQHVAEQYGGRDDGEDHHGLAQRVAQDVPDLLGLVEPVDQDGEDQAERGADAGGFRRRGDPAVEHVHHAGDDEEERRDLRHRLELFLPGIAEALGVRLETLAPDRKDRPDHEKAGEQQSRQNAGDEQAADRGFGGDAVQDESH